METRNSVPAKIGKYEILNVIGRGGMGVVYSARDPVIDRIVAIKTIRIAEEDCDDDQLGRLRWKPAPRENCSIRTSSPSTTSASRAARRTS